MTSTLAVRCDWDLVFDWPMGRWSNKPEAKWLPILLRRKSWPAMVGANIQAERDGPDNIVIGISVAQLAPLQQRGFFWPHT
jgi:hypothetical protein